METSVDGTAVETQTPFEGKQLFGHPRGLMTLFFTEMWERFSFYGMKALLILYMTAPLVADKDNPLPGLGFDEKKSAFIYSLYASSVYLTPLIGGWIADRFLGARRATLIGAIVIACGHFSMAFHTLPNFYGGLILIASGTGLLKSNISTMVGDLYKKGDARRDAGFSIFYMGINLGAFIAPLVCGYLGQRVDWHYGFAAAGVGMVLGVLQYTIFGGGIKHVGLPPGQRPQTETQTTVAPKQSLSASYLISLLVVLGIGIILMVLLGINYMMPIFLLVGLAAVLLTGMQDKLTSNEWKRIILIGVLFFFSCVFWSGFEQASTSLNLFADRLTDLSLPGGVIDFMGKIPLIGGWLHSQFAQGIPSTWFQSINAIFIIAFASIFSLLWTKMDKRQPSDPVKFVFALLFLGFSFVVITYASSLIGAGKVAKGWLIIVYLFNTFGELCLSPVGLSSMTKLAPIKMAGLMMGVWFLSISMGNYVAGQIAGEFKPDSAVLVGLFGKVAIFALVGGVVLAILTPFIKKLTAPKEIVA